LKTRRLDSYAIGDAELELVGISREQAEWGTERIATENLYQELDRELAKRETAARLSAELGIPMEHFERMQQELRRPADDAG